MKRLVGFFVLSVSGYFSQGQSCSQILSRAEDNYEAGKLLAILKEDKSLGVLDFIECIDYKGEGALSKEERIRAKKLLTKVYIFTDNEALAEIALIGLLKEDPEHILDPQTDPSELLYLMQQFRTAPIFRVGLRVGANLCNPYIIGDYSTSSIPKFYNGKTKEGESVYIDEFGNEYNPSAGPSIGIMMELVAERKLYQGLDASIGVQYRSSKYNVESFVNPNVNTSLSNNQRYLRMPLGIKYTLWNTNREKSVLPYVFGGGSIDYLSSAFYESTRSGGNAFTVVESGGDIIEAGIVNRVNFSLYGGAGVKFRIKTHFVNVDIRYDSSLKNYINSNERFTGSATKEDIGNKFMIFDSAYTEDNLSLNYLSVAVGFTYSVHKPRKLKEYR